MRLEKAERVMQLAIELQGARLGLSLADIEQRFGVKRRTAIRMRDAVARLFPHIEEQVGDDRRKRWRLPGKALAGALSFSADELADVEAAAAVLERDNRIAQANSVRAIAAKLKASLAEAQARRVEPDLEALLESEGLGLRPGPRPAVRPDIYETLRDALKQCRRVYMVYASRDGTRRSGRTVEPYGLLFGNRHYLVARDARGHDGPWKLFGLSGIRSVKLTAASFTRDPGFSLRAFAARAFGVFQERQRDVAWRFAPRVAAVAGEYLFHPTQTLALEEDGSLVVRFRAGGLLEMAWHLVTWGPDVEVIEPVELRTVLARVRRGERMF